MKMKDGDLKCKDCLFLDDYICRRSAPVGGGFPIVDPKKDWCGDLRPDLPDFIHDLVKSGGIGEAMKAMDSLFKGGKNG